MIYLHECPSGVNPRYWLYANAHGHTVPVQMAADTLKWPGGCMTGFICWVGSQWRAFCDLHKVRGPDAARLKFGGATDAMFDVWLCEKGTPLQAIPEEPKQ